MKRQPPLSIKSRSGKRRKNDRGVMLILFSLIGLPGSLVTAQEEAPQTSFHGRVVDEAGKAVSGARVSLYIQTGRWEHRDILVRRMAASADGSFAFHRPPDLHRGGTTSPNRGFVFLADHPGYAVGWRNIHEWSKSFQGEIVLTRPLSRTISVTDEKGRPVAGARVWAHMVGDRFSPPVEFGDPLEDRTDDGPLTTIADAEGRATLHHLPEAEAAFLAEAPGYARTYTATYAPVNKDRIRLTPAATLTGTVKDEVGKPVEGCTVVVQAAFNWYFDRTRTDADGHYRFEGLPARGWDMSGWGQAREGDGSYAMALDSPEHAVRQIMVLLAPREVKILDIVALPAVTVEVSVIDKRTGGPVPEIRILGASDAMPVEAVTDANGVATVSTPPGRFQVRIVGAPPGLYLLGEAQVPEARYQGNVTGRASKIILTMPPIGGPLVSISGECKLSHDGNSPAGSVDAATEPFQTSSGVIHTIVARVNSTGHFTLEDVPAGRRVALYAQTRDQRSAGGLEVTVPESPDSKFHPVVTLRPLVKATRSLMRKDGTGLDSLRVRAVPVVGDQEFFFHRREATTDAQGRVEFSGIVPGLAYHLKEAVDRGNRVRAMHDQNAVFDETLVLAPIELK
jgi:protocatechuate 3,4-dioxygenase beta subunit